MNYFIKCQLLSEGFKHEQLIEENWEDLKKELTGLYVAGKITERQISTRLARAGMGSLSKNAAYKIANDPSNLQKREAVFQKIKDEEEKKAKEKAIAAQAAKHQTRGSAAAEYNSEANRAAWLKVANEYRAKQEKERASKGNLSASFVKAWNNHPATKHIKAYLDENFSEEEVNYIMESINMDNEELKCLLEDTAQYLLENGGPKKFVNGLKKAALGVAAGGILAAAPGVVGGVRNAKAQSDARKQAAQEYQMSKDEINAKQNEIARKTRETGISFGNATKEAGKAVGNATKEAGKAVGNAAQSGYKKAVPAVKNFANKSKEELKELYEKGKISLEEYRAAKKAAKEATNETVKEEVNYFNY